MNKAEEERKFLESQFNRNHIVIEYEVDETKPLNFKSLENGRGAFDGCPKIVSIIIDAKDKKTIYEF